ncbi:MAG TPA: hypothetical protein VHD55_03850 [Candidatus Paceibacterota bacterium]|nr:hypothetical protein [Candidatus Paceibacterota bacterium]
MDELEISGKRYISTRLAAKQYKYHADYIGQLIRAKKIVGQKVGRSWYVDAEFLADYLKNPKPAEEPKKILSVAPVVRAEAAEEVPEPAETEEEKPEPAAEKEEETAEEEETEAEATAPVIPEPIQSFRRPIQVEELIADFAPEEIKVEEAEEKVFVEIEPEAARESIHIPIRLAETKKKTGLRYIEDAAPSLPEIQKPASKKAKASVMPKAAEEDADEEVTITEYAPSKKYSVGMLMPAFSIMTLGAVVFAVVALSSLLVNSTTVIEAGKTASVGYSLH